MGISHSHPYCTKCTYQRPLYQLYIICYMTQVADAINPLIPTLKPQSNGPLYSNTVIGNLAVDGWAVTFGTTRRDLGWAQTHPDPSLLYQMMGGLLHLVQRGGVWVGWGPTQVHPRCTKCNSPPINGQRTNFILFDVAL